MIKILIDKVKNEKNEDCFKGMTNKHAFDVNFINEKTGYTPLHWLAFNNDHCSINEILNSGIFTDLKSILRFSIIRSFTPICIAGTRKNLNSIKVFIDYFDKNSNLISKNDI